MLVKRVVAVLFAVVLAYAPLVPGPVSARELPPAPGLADDAPLPGNPLAPTPSGTASPSPLPTSTPTHSSVDSDPTQTPPSTTPTSVLTQQPSDPHASPTSSDSPTLALTPTATPTASPTSTPTVSPAAQTTSTRFVSVAEAQPRGEPRVQVVGGRSVTVRPLLTVTTADGRRAAAGRIIVGFKDSVDEAGKVEVHSGAAARGVANARGLAKLGKTAQVVDVSGAPSIEAALRSYRADPRVRYAEPDYVRTAAETPNDPLFPEDSSGNVEDRQWAPRRIQAPAAWDVSHAASTIKIAILDTGIFSHSSVFGDDNGYPDGHPDVGAATKVVLEKNFSSSGDVDDNYNHGTHVAGIAAAFTNNGLGVAGLGWNAVLLNGKVLGDDGNGTISSVNQGIYWAADNGAHVINMSLGGTGSCLTSEQEAINYAWNRGVVVVAAAGNSGASSSDAPGNCQNVLSVAATDVNDARASFSNYGANVDLAAPGKGIISSTFDGGYGAFNGTSMATPHVAGVAALLWGSTWGASTPTTAGRDAVVARLTQRADAITGTGSLWQYGRLNALRAACGVDAVEAPVSVFDGLAADARYMSATSVSANWASVTGATGYEYAIGTNAGLTDVVGFTDRALNTSVTHPGLSLTHGATYYVLARAYNADATSCHNRSNGFVVDGMAPTSSATAPASSAWVKTLTAISGSAADSHSGLASVAVSLERDADGFYWDGDEWVNTGEVWLSTAGTTSWSRTTDLPSGANLPDGSYTVRSRATDAVGNVETPGAGNLFHVDNTAPTVIRTTIVPAGGAAGNLAQGVGYTVYVQAEDTGGSGVASATANLSALTSGATSVSLTAGSHTVGGQSYNYSATATADQTLSEGARQYTANATDNATNQSAYTNNGAVTVENVAPTVSLTGLTALYLVNQPADITATAADSGSGLSSVTFQYRLSGAGTFTTLNVDATDPYQLDWAATTLADGLYDVRALATDNAGNTATDDESFTVEVDPPTSSVTTPTNGASLNQLASLSGSASDAGAGVALVVVSLERDADGFYWDGAAWVNTGEVWLSTTGTTSWSRTTDLPSGADLPDGSYTVRSRGTDNAAKVETPGAGNVFTVDTVAPAVPVITRPSSGTPTVNANSYRIEGTVEANALVRIWRDANANGQKDSGESQAGSQQLTGGATSFSIGVSLSQNATNRFVVTATDAADNESLGTSATIVEDSPPPSGDGGGGSSGGDSGGGGDTGGGGSSGGGDSGGGGGGGSSSGSGDSSGGGSSGGGGAAPASSTNQAPSFAPVLTAQPTLTPSQAPEPTPVPLVNGARLAGDPVHGRIPPTGGVVGTADGSVTLSFPASASGGATLLVDIYPIAPDSVPSGASILRIGDLVFQVSVTNAATGEPVTRFPTPLTLVVRLSAPDLALLSGDFASLTIAYWDGAAWVALPCTFDSASGQATCALSHLSLFGVVLAPEAVDPLDYPLPNGHFFKQANGFGGAGEVGFAVVDDAQAAFWSEFQRMGGVQRVGYPISTRFNHRGFLTQVFQKLALQWRPDEGRAVPVNVFDDLNRKGADSWLDAVRQVPPAADTSADAGLSFEQVVARHVAFLDPYPELHAFYTGDPNALETYGLPLSVHDYGPFVAVRMQRAGLQLWKVDVPWAAAGQVVVANGGDIAREAGLWPPEALGPTVPGRGAAPADPAQLAVADAAQRLGLDPSRVQVVSAEPREWPDASLGCPQPGERYAQVVTPGFLVLIDAVGQRLTYHTDTASRAVLCQG